MGKKVGKTRGYKPTLSNIYSVLIITKTIFKTLNGTLI